MRATRAPIVRRIMTTVEVYARLGRTVMDDAIRAGWLKPCCLKECEKKTKSFFAVRDVEAVEERMIVGEYPAPSAPPAPKRTWMQSPHHEMAHWVGATRNMGICGARAISGGWMPADPSKPKCRVCKSKVL